MNTNFYNNITITLVKTKTSANIGSVARAMNCMGFKKLALVSPRCQIDRESFSLAVGSDDILKNAKIYFDFKDFLSNFSLIVGTTKKTGKKRMNFTTPEIFSKNILTKHLNSNIAILFGAEDYGLSMSELKECSHLIYIPVSEEFGSLNLSQAVMILCYEMRKSLENVNFNHTSQKASSDDMARLSKVIDKAFVDVKYPIPSGTFSPLSHLKEIISRASLEKFEVNMLMGMARHASYIGNKFLK